MPVYPSQNTFARGELSPRLHGRTDIEHYAMGLAVARNWIVLRQGGITRRPGTRYIQEVKDSTKTTRLIRFEFSERQAYALEFGNQYIRFFTNGGFVEQPGMPGTPYEVSTPYVSGDLFDIQYTQSGDTIYLVHPDYAPRTLVRNTEQSWTLSELSFVDGPYMDEELTSGTMTPADRGSIVPIMSDNTTPSGTASNSDSGTDAYRAFNGDASSSMAVTGTTGWVQYDFSGNRVADAYFLVASSSAEDATPISWEFQGWNGSSWVVLDTRTNETGWRAGERRYYEFVNGTGYSKYRFEWSGVDGNSNSRIGELVIHRAATDQTAFNLTLSSSSIINGGSGWVSGDVGRPIRLYGSDGVWRWAKVIARTSSTVATIQLYGHALIDLSPISRWQLGTFTSARGYPKAVGFFEERLAFAGTASEPGRVWLSKSADFDNFGISQPLADDDAIAAEMTGGKFSEIAWIEEVGDLAIATGGSMRILAQSDQADPFSATNARQKQQNTYGAKAMQPVVIGSRAIYADRYGRKLMEFGYDYQSNGYQSAERSIFSDHLFRDEIREISFQQDPNDILWSVIDNGRLACTTYVPVQDVYGMTDVRIAGWTSSVRQYGSVESAVSIPSEEGDVLYMVVRRFIDGAYVRYIEYMTRPYEDGDDLTDACYLDCAATYDGTATSAVTGLDYLEGETVGVFADGVDLGDAEVASGEITLPGGAEASVITVGLRYQSYAETLRATQMGQRDGAALGRKKKIGEVFVDVLDTATLDVGTPEGVQEAVGRQWSETMDSEVTLYTGVFNVTGVDDSSDNQGVVVMQTDRAYPATVRALVMQIEGEP